MILDLAVAGAALLPVALHAKALGVLSAALSPACLFQPSWWLCVGGVSLLYGMHGLIWNRPDEFVAVSKKPPLSLLGPKPWKVFAKLELIGKVWQVGCIAAFLGAAGRSAALTALSATPAPVVALAVGYIAAGQTLNVGMYTSIGDAGVYYGWKLGIEVPWCSGFPFNVGLRHPQYVGVMLTIWGSLALLLSAETAQAMLPQVLLAWGSMYIAMCIMEQLADNDTASKGK